jgi:predicted HicB family RNase H-like nuclease
MSGRRVTTTEGGTVARRKSETRQLTKLVGVRLAPEDHDALSIEASRRQISVPELLREVALSTLSAAS